MKKENVLFYFGILPALAFQFVGAFFYFVILRDKVFSQVLYGATKILLIVWPIIWFFYLRDVFRYYLIF